MEIYSVEATDGGFAINSYSWNLPVSSKWWATMQPFTAWPALWQTG